MPSHPKMPGRVTERVRLHAAVLLSALSCVQLMVAPAQAKDLFELLTGDGAPGHVYRTGASGERYLPEIMGGGGALFDADNDGDLDLFLVQGGDLGPTVDPAQRPSDLLLRNDLKAGQPKTLGFTARTTALTEHEYGMGAAAADFDNDGFVDLYVLNLGPNELWRNRGDGTFEALGSSAGVDDRRWSISASPADFDGDGWLDLYVVNYVDFRFHRHRQCPAANSRLDYCGPLNYPGSEDRLYRNLGVDANGQLRFADVTAEAGLSAPDSRGLGSVAADLDGDGRLDLYVANDQMANHFWMQTGRGPRGFPRFADEALLAGLSVNARGAAEASMGVAPGDFDNDGDLDLFLTHLRGETNTLYVNDGDALFLDRSNEAAIGAPSLPYTAFGTAWIDFENDGWLDLAAVNGTIRSVDEQLAAGDPLPLRQRNQLFRSFAGPRGRRFEEVSDLGGDAFRKPGVSRGLLRGDLDNDGDADLVVVDLDEPTKVLLSAGSADNHWLGLRLIQGDGGRRESAQLEALGATARVEMGRGRTATATVRTDGSYASAHDPRLLFGLGTATPETVDVTWPDGRIERFEVDSDRYQTLVRGAGSTPAVSGDGGSDD